MVEFWIIACAVLAAPLLVFFNGDEEDDIEDDMEDV